MSKLTDQPGVAAGVKPSFIIQDSQGMNNANLDATTDRLIKGNSWKKRRIVVVLPAGEMIPAQVALSLWNLVFPPNQNRLIFLAQGMEVGDAYSNAIESIIAHPELKDWEYVLTVEWDNLPPNDGVMTLLRAMDDHPEYAAISGLYFTKGMGGVAQIWGDISDPHVNFRPVPPRVGEVIECYGIGMGFALWRMEFLKDKRIERPLFKTIAGKEGAGTQDLSLAVKARQFGYRFAVDGATRVGHLDFTGDFGPKGEIY